MDLNGHLSFRDSTLTFLLKERIFLHAHHKINKNQQWQRKAALLPLITLAINVHIIKIIIKNFNHPPKVPTPISNHHSTGPGDHDI